MENKQTMLYKTLCNFYKNNTNMKILYNYVTKNESISLRIFDFLCTKYAKNNNVVYYITKNNKQIPFNLNVSYKAQLKAYSKQQFDPFKRHERITIPCVSSPTKNLTTTIGQMNFFKFVIESKLIDWIKKSDNLKKIENEISNELKKKSSKDKSTGIIKKKNIASTNNLKITVTFK